MIDNVRNEATENEFAHNICFDLTACTGNCSSSEYTVKSRVFAATAMKASQGREPGTEKSQDCIYFLVQY